MGESSEQVSYNRPHAVGFCNQSHNRPHSVGLCDRWRQVKRTTV